MKSTKVAKRYAKSLMELALEQNKLESISADMQYLLETNSNNDFHLLLKSPIINSDKKISIFKEIFAQFDDLSSSFITLIAKNGREGILPEIASAFDELVKTHKGIVDVTLVSASALDSDTKQNILNKIKTIVGGTVELTEKIDPSLIGGFIIKMGDKQIDASVSSRLNKLKLSFLN